MTIVSASMIGAGTISLMRFFPDSTVLAVGLAIAAVALAIFNWNVLRKRDDNVTLTIAEDGRISLSRRCRFRNNASDAPESGQPEIVQLMPDSTLWSFYILLRLRQQNKSITVASFFLYSLSPQSFRRLSLACRWIIARNDVVRANS